METYDEIEPCVNIANERQPLRVTYTINRKVYNEEEFERDHDQKIYSQTNQDFETPPPGRRIQCRFSCARFKELLIKTFPVLNWIFSYRITEWILGDIHAGITVGLVQIFQGLSGILLTGLPLPVVNSFYSAFCCSLTYVIFGTSRHISIGSFSILNVMMANFHNALDFNVRPPGNNSLDSFSDATFTKKYMEVLTYTASTTFLVGMIQILLGVFGLGFVTTYVSESLMNAYLTAAALHVIMSQFSFIFGIVIDFHSGPLAFFYNLAYYCMGIPKANSTSILLFLLSMLLLRVSKCIKITYKHYPVEFPMELLLIIVFTIISSQTRLYAESSKGVFNLAPQSFLYPVLPDVSKWKNMALHASSLAIVSYFLLIFVGKKYANMHNYHVRHTQDLMAIGLCNIFSSFFKSFVVSCAISTTVIQEKSGGKTQLAALIGVSLMLGIVLKLGYYFQYLPNAVLAAIILANMFPFLEKFMDIPFLWRQDKYDFGIWIVTFLAVLCLGLDIGLGIAMGFAFFIISVRSQRMKMLTLGQIPSTNIYRSFSDYNEALEIQGLKIFQCCASISFANMKNFKRYILRKMDMKAVPLNEHEMRALISQSMSTIRGQNKDLKCSCVCDPPEPLPRVPYTEKLIRRVHTSESFSSSSLALLCHAFQNTGITVLIAACHPTVMRSFEKMDFFDHCVTKARFFPTLHDAVLYAVEPDLLQEEMPVEDENIPPDEVFADVHLDDQKDRRSQLSGRNPQLDRRSEQSDGIRDTHSLKTFPSDAYLDEPISNLFRTFSLQSDVETVPRHLEMTPVQENKDGQGWDGKWKYSNDV
ncbi:testis anion transporter 1 isoform X3 [Anolis carolinensis]|uniref:testis anion transporter 1 isoform X3 n=1 Tax=Anolis carolinensis TaxID=28377 RepID=UPI002F2B3AD2